MIDGKSWGRGCSPLSSLTLRVEVAGLAVETSLLWVMVAIAVNARWGVDVVNIDDAAGEC